MADQTGARIRERVWITKFDHSGEQPEPVEEVFVENGEVKGVRDLRDARSTDREDERAPR